MPQHRAVGGDPDGQGEEGEVARAAAEARAAAAASAGREEEDDDDDDDAVPSPCKARAGAGAGAGAGAAWSRSALRAVEDEEVGRSEGRAARAAMRRPAPRRELCMGVGVGGSLSLTRGSCWAWLGPGSV